MTVASATQRKRHREGEVFGTDSGGPRREPRQDPGGRRQVQTGGMTYRGGVSQDGDCDPQVGHHAASPAVLLRGQEQSRHGITTPGDREQASGQSPRANNAPLANQRRWIDRRIPLGQAARLHGAGLHRVRRCTGAPRRRGQRRHWPASRSKSSLRLTSKRRRGESSLRPVPTAKASEVSPPNRCSRPASIKLRSRSPRSWVSCE